MRCSLFEILYALVNLSILSSHCQREKSKLREYLNLASNRGFSIYSVFVPYFMVIVALKRSESLVLVYTVELSL